MPGKHRLRRRPGIVGRARHHRANAARHFRMARVAAVSLAATLALLYARQPA